MVIKIMTTHDRVIIERLPGNMLDQEMDTEMDDIDDHWEHKSIEILLNMYLQNLDKFRDPKIKKRSVWIEISHAVGKTPESCDKKFRNLKQTYVKILKKAQNGAATVKWPYFDIFEEIYGPGEYQSDMQQKVQQSTIDTVAKALLTMNSSNKLEPDIHENGESSNHQLGDVTIEYVQSNVSSHELDTEMDDGDDHWEHNSVQILLNKYLQNVERFRNPKTRKKNLWIDISNAVGKGPDICDKKFRNLKQTYVRLLMKKNRNGLAAVKWPYFDIFEEIFSENGEYQPDIQQKLQETTTDTVAKALLTMNSSNNYEFEIHDNVKGSSRQSEEVKKKMTRKRQAEFRKVALEMNERQRAVEEKLDRLINIVEESNSIQKERNRLFEQFLDRFN